MSFGADALSQLGAAFAQALLSALWVGAAVSIVVALFVRFHRGLNAASRHAAWYAALIVIALMPIVSMAVSLARLSVIATPAPAPVTTAVSISIAANPPPSASVLAQESTHSVQQPSATAPVVSPATLERVGIGAAIAAAAIAAVRIAMLLGGLFGLARVKRASRIVDPSLSPTLARTIERDADARRVHVRLSDALDTPAAAGFRSPAILLPVELVDSLDPESLDQIAMHEYAHLRRYDDWTNLFQKVIERLYWFNPAIWFVGSRIDLEREIACDDWAVAGADGVSRYADCLWQLAHDGRVPVFAATAPGAFLTRNQITARIEHLLERHRDGAPALRPARLLAIAPVLAAAIAIVAGRAPAIALHVAAPAQTHAIVGIHMVAAPVKVAVSTAMPCPTTEHVTTQHGWVRTTVTIDRAAVQREAAAAVNRAQIAAEITRRAQLSAQEVTEIAHRAQAGANAATSEAKRQAQIAYLTAQVDAAVKKAMTQNDVQPQIQHAVEQAAAAARQATLRHIHVEVHVDQKAIQHAVRSSSPVIAEAVATDNLSFGPNDRNLLAHCTGCDLSNRDLRNVDLHGLTLTGDDLSGADLRGANLRGTVLTGVDLSDAKLDGADLRGASLTGSDIDGASFANAKTDGIKLVGMQLTNAILSTASARTLLSACAGCDLSNLNLRGRDLHGITLDGADLHGTDLSNTNLQGARFNGVDLSGVRFDGADLRHAEFNGCDLRNVDLGHAQTDGMQLQGSDIGSDSTD